MAVDERGCVWGLDGEGEGRERMGGGGEGGGGGGWGWGGEGGGVRIWLHTVEDDEDNVT